MAPTTWGREEPMKGMYCNKYKVNKKADAGPLSIHLGDSYVKKKTRKGPSNLKPFSVKDYEKSKKPTGSDLFSWNFANGESKPLAPSDGKGTEKRRVFHDAYQEKVVYRNRPRKKGFGTGDAPKRDEFSNNIAVEQYREAIGNELKTAKAAAMRMLESAPEAAPEDRHEEKEEVFLFDQVFQVQEDTGVGTATKKMRALNLGSLRTSNARYGKGCEKPKADNKYGRYAIMKKSFSNTGHIEVAPDEY